MRSKFAMQLRIVSLVCAAAILVACQTDATYYAKPEDNPAYLPGEGTTLTLHQPLTIAPDTAGVYLQFGKITAFNQIQRYHAHCRFEIYRLSTDSQVVQPDSFTIQKITQQESSFDSHTLRRVSRYDDGGVAFMYYATNFYLSSATQPNAYRLICGHWLLANEGRYLSITEIRSALGNILTLK